MADPVHVAITDGLILEYSNAGNKLSTAFTQITFTSDAPLNIRHLCLNHVGGHHYEELNKRIRFGQGG